MKRLIPFLTALVFACSALPTVSAQAGSAEAESAQAESRQERSAPSQPSAQSTQAAPSAASTQAHDFDLTIPASQSWTDTGIEFSSGDRLQITAVTVSAGSQLNVPDRHAVSQGGAICDPRGIAGGSSSNSNLPVTSAPAGALIGKLHSQDAAFLIGAHKELKAEEPGHLYLAANTDGQPACAGAFTVKVHLISAQAAAGPSSGAPASGTPSSATQTSSPPVSRAAEAKSKLAAAAQTWLAGQFGTPASGAAQPAEGAPAAAGSTAVPGKTAAAPAAPALQISTASLDPQLQKAIDHLPRRVNDQFQHLGDMVNFVIIGPQQKVQDALQAANWFVADKSKTEAVLNAVAMTKENQDYLQMPMSQLYLFGRVQDFGYEQAEAYAVVATRHHFRLWKAFDFNGQPVWVGAGTHDIGFEKDQRNGSVTHKIDPAVDGERDHIGESLQKTGKVKSLTYYLPPNPVQEAKNATGGGYHSDGRILVISVQ